MPIPFLDTNVLLRHLLRDHPEHSPRATALVGRIERGELHVRISETVVFETVFTLERTYRRPKSLISEGVQSLLELRGIELPGKRLFIRVFELYASLNISFADAYHAALMEQRKLTEILTFDRDFDRIPGIQRIEP